MAASFRKIKKYIAQLLTNTCDEKISYRENHRPSTIFAVSFGKQTLKLFENQSGTLSQDHLNTFSRQIGTTTNIFPEGTSSSVLGHHPPTIPTITCQQDTSFGMEDGTTFVVPGGAVVHLISILTSAALITTLPAYSALPALGLVDSPSLELKG